jgi:hypothetical protein
MMNLSSSTLAAWLAITSSTSTNAFITTQVGSNSRTNSQQQLSMLLKQEKFDKIITTNRNKDLGYNDRDGRFFEIQSSSTDTQEEQAVDAQNKLQQSEEALNAVVDIPPMPDAGFDGMNVTGEINGVKMTASSNSMKRKRSEETADSDEILAAAEETAELDSKTTTLTDRISNSGAVSAAAVATAAVNAAVSMKSLSAPSVDKSYISLDSTDKAIDEEGLPLVYDKDLIELYWKKERGALNQRWSYFVGKAVPFLTKLVTLFISEGEINERHIPGLSRQARLDLQDLGPTFIKAGQVSIVFYIVLLNLHFRSHLYLYLIVLVRVDDVSTSRRTSSGNARRAYQTSRWSRAI